MGQYYMVCNTSKKAFMSPRDFGDGLKMLEFGFNQNGVMAALAEQISVTANYTGPWAFDKIVVAGDYGQPGRFIEDVRAEYNLFTLTSTFGQKKGLEYELFEEVTKADIPALSSEPLSGYKAWQANVKKVMQSGRSFDQPEDLFGALNIPMRDSVAATLVDLSTALKAAGSKVALLSRPISRAYVEVDDKGMVYSISAHYPDMPGDWKKNLKNTLFFPATVKDVYSFFDCAW